MNNKNNPFLPFAFALILGVGIYIGYIIQEQPQRKADIQEEASKITDIIDYIETNYVDSVDRQILINKTISEMLAQLDPHSSYLTSEQLQRMNEPLEGKFGGVGIRFLIHRDTLSVTHVVDGGPSKLSGIIPGDRIIAINDSSITGGELKNTDVLDLLKGTPGTGVDITLYRDGKTIKKEIIRGSIPLNSIDVSLMLDNEIGYIKLSRFAATSYEEFVDAVISLQSKGMKKLIFDLRNNSGGYLRAATDISDEFLSSGKLIVYTEGVNSPKSSTFATPKGRLKNTEVAVLINGGSASASEIVAGALQDNDRGIIMGRRSFGKGLVQNQEMLKDGSALRLTISRYYTPTGRSIQKPYGDGIDYYDDYVSRIESGELMNKDSIKINDSLKFVTAKGKVVYGGGGIIPDIFIPDDTSGYSYYYNMLFYRNIFNHYSFDQASKRRFDFKSIDDFEKRFKVTDAMLNDFASYADSMGVKIDDTALITSKPLIKKRLKAEIAQQIWDQEGFYSINLEIDSDVKEAMEALKDRSL